MSLMFHETPIAKALARVIIAAGWADGELQREEVDCLKDLLFQLPDLSVEDWRELESLMNKPVLPGDADTYLTDLRQMLNSEEELAFAYYALDRVICADGVVTREEVSIINHMKQALGEVCDQTLSEMRELLRSPLELRQSASTDKLKRMSDMEEYLHVRIFNLETDTVGIPLPGDELRRLSLAGILLSFIIQADDRIEDGEILAAVSYLMDEWDLERDKAEFIVQISVSDKLEGLDLIRICRWFFEVTQEHERIGFLDVLFEIGMADGVLSEVELDTIMNIAANLKLEQHHFQAALDRIMQSA